ncbi:MAG: MmcQ/YjbR family DNA-binding protein [Gemmatimonadota bacterium]|nr:MmcQ/YjbR family DNA-binding protein [Gemmatimonadota bacterium]
MTVDVARQLLLRFPGVEEGPCYGTPGFRVRGRFLARLRDNDTVLVVKCGDIERDLRMQADPNAFFTTDHYRGWPTVLVRLDSVTRKDLRDVLEVAWLLSAPKRLRAAFERERQTT